MVSLLTEFHFALKDLPKFDIGKDGFSIKKIYDHFALKHSKSTIHQMNDKLFMAQIDRAAKDKDEYEALWMKTRKYSQLVATLYEKPNAPKPEVKAEPAKPAAAPVKPAAEPVKPVAAPAPAPVAAAAPKAQPEKK